jgi:HKD family nuclease
MPLGLELLLNRGDGRDHAAILNRSLRNAMKFDCVVAFAKATGLTELKDALEKRVEDKCRVRIAVGLDLYVTEPAALKALLEFADVNPKYVEAYVTPFDPTRPRKHTFHPKVFVMTDSAGNATVVIGSANLTRGGLLHNTEASVVVTDHALLAAQVRRFFGRLIADEEIESLTPAILREYTEAHAKFAASRKQAESKAQAGAAKAVSAMRVANLAQHLANMRNDPGPEGFDAQIRKRRANRLAARRMLEEIAHQGAVSTQVFQEQYAEFLRYLHASGMQRKKGGVPQHREQFASGVRAALRAADSTPSEAYEAVNAHLIRVDGAGVNVISEILHAVNPKRYAVMNKNSISGLSSTGATGFPRWSSKASVRGKGYGSFCAACDKLRKRLQLRDMTELDALYNSRYWSL